MAAARRTLAYCVLFFMAWQGGALTWSQEAAGTPPAAVTSPEQVLKGLGLTRSGTTWILPDEKTVLKDLRDGRELYGRIEQGMMHQQMLAQDAHGRQEMLLQLRQQSSAMNQSIAEIDTQLEALVVPPGGNNFVQLQRQELSQQRNQMVLEHNRLVNQLNTLQEISQPKDLSDDPRLQANAEVAQTREKYMQAVLDMRKSVDEVTAKYNELAKQPEVTKALAALSASTKSRHRLGPSKAMLDAIKVLERAEGTVKSATIELHREGGVFHLYATLNKVPTKMVFDTGAGVTTISAALAKKIGLTASPGDSPIKLKTADGTVVEGKLMTIKSVRVGKFTIPNVQCAVMPAEKGDVDPLLGQSFLKFFSVDFSAESGRLNLKRVETEGTATAAQDDAQPGAAAPRATTKSRKTRPQTRGPARSKAGTRSRQPSRESLVPPAAGSDEGSSPPG